MSKRKISAILIAVFVTVVTSASVISYSLATKERNGLENNVITENSVMAYGNLGNMSYISNIDMIIENSNKESDYTYNIVEIIPDSVAGSYTSGLKQYINGGGFKEYVIDSHKSSATGTMKAGTIAYKAVTIKASTTLSSEVTYGSETTTVQDVLNSADLIYLASPSYTSYTTTDNLPEEIYNWLHNYAMEKDNERPLIFDYVTENMSTTVTDKTYKDFVNAVASNYIKYRTYSWNIDGGVSAENFFQSNGSYYITFNGNKKQATGNVLIISSNNSTAGTLESALGNGNVIKDNAYFGSRPSSIKFTRKTPGELDSNVGELAAGKYDFIIIEDDVAGTKMTSDVYSALKKLSETSNYILYDASMLSSGSNGSISAGKSNYHKLMSLLVNNSGVAKYNTVLPVTNSFFENLNSAGKDGLDSAKSVADIIDYGSYRGNKGGEGSKMFRVLEIEPCYPVDTKLAQAQKKYYTDPDGVLYGVTSDEIPEDTEYYAFEISKAKIAHATGLNYNQIQVDQMSTNEFISSKEVVVENYDLVYIGGDFSALKSSLEISYNNGQNLQYVNDRQKTMTYFNMYTHTGYWVELASNDMAGYIGNPTYAELNGNDITVLKLDELKDYVDAGMPIIIDGAVADAFKESYQHDKQNESATDVSRLKQLGLKSIDPDCNMYKFLVYAYEKYKEQSDPDTTATKNICFGEFSTKADGSTVQVDNGDRSLGNTLGSFATVYNKDISPKIANLINQSSTRPKLVVSNKPVDYVEGDSSTTNKDTTLTVSCSIKSMSTEVTKYKLGLYIDKNGDNTFSDDELADGSDGGKGLVSYDTESSGTIDLTYSLPEDFFGLVSWKVVASVVKTVNGKEVVTTICDTATGYAYYKPEDDMKKTVRVLEIMPIDRNQQSYSDKHRLYFCTECQQVGKIITGNVMVTADNAYPTNTVGYNGASVDSVTNVSKVNDKNVYKYLEPMPGVNPGLHVHDFGIPIYDSSTQNEDWEANFADTLTHGDDGTLDTGDFEFELDIISSAEFEEYCAAAQTLNDNKETTKVDGENVSVRDTTYAVNIQKSVQLKQRINALEEDDSYKALKKNVRDAMITYVEKHLNTISKATSIVKEGVGTSAKPGQWMVDDEYYKFWEYVNQNCSNIISTRPNAGAAVGSAEHDLYNVVIAWNDYIKYHDEIVKLKNEYNEVSRLATTSDKWLKNNYDMVVLGFADDFGNKDLNSVAVSQLKSYIEAGGSVLNTHDTMTKYKSSGALNLTNELREAFGMDRFHIVDGSTSNTVTCSYEVPIAVSNKVIICPIDGANQYWQGIGAFDITYTNKDVNATVTWSNSSFNNDRNIIETETIHNNTSEKVCITIDMGSGGANKFITYSVGDSNVYTKVQADANGKVSINVDQVIGTKTYDATFNVSDNNLTGTWDITGKTIDTEKGSAATDNKCKVELDVVDNGNPVANNTQVKVTYRNTTTSKTVANGKLSLVFDLNQKGTSNIYNASSTGSKYRKYSTKDNNKYFFTERAVIDDSNYAAWESKIFAGYNTPIGFTDAFIVYGNNSYMDRTQYKYARLDNQIFTSTDGDYFTNRFFYGTRRASQVNVGSVTVYPFTVNSELMIAATHAQAYALDLEDDSVCVWYTIGGSAANDTLGTNANAWDFTSYFSASPHDGMNNYFLYSKDNVFYCGAGHSVVTGARRDNNDERRLFINVIVNSVTKAKSIPKIKLYNVCDKDGHGNCEDNLVSKNGEDNKKLSKQKNTLFYNESLGMYQYNIEEDQEYPLFDFKIIEGNAKLDKVYVFYDLDYGTGDGQDTSSMYTDLSGKPNSKHVLLSDYTDKSVSDISGERCKLRSTTKNLKLKDEYFSSSNSTYIVIYTVDKNGEVAAARVMINRIPYLFDLTDATIQNRHQSFTMFKFLMDITDKTKFNI